ncbi:MAG: hypothetical protein K2N27_11480 [Ruminococcus sp.]|nr:hypothetical protein [Ruminococcus sp.]
MNNNQNQFGNKRLAKLVLENTAFNNCRSDMSDISFEIGKSSYSVKIFLAIVLFAVVFGGRILLRRHAGNPNYSMSATDIAFWAFIGFIFICTVVYAIIHSKKPNISVSGKTVFYNGNCWNSDEISCVKCSKWFEYIEVYSGGKKIIAFPWEKDNSELFIAWTKKCGILFEDNRINLGK